MYIFMRVKIISVYYEMKFIHQKFIEFNFTDIKYYVTEISKIIHS